MSKHATHDGYTLTPHFLPVFRTLLSPTSFVLFAGPCTDLVALAKSCGEGNYDGVADLVVHGKMPMHKLEDVYASLTKDTSTVNERFVPSAM